MKNQKCNKSILLFSLLCFFLFNAVATVATFAQSNEKEKHLFYERIDSIKGLDRSDQLRQIRAYLSSLPDRSLFDLMDIIAQENSFPIYQNIFISHMKTRWGRKSPINEIVLEAKNKGKNIHYRSLMIDFLSASLKRKARSEGIETDQTTTELKKVINEFESIVEDRSDSTEVRTVAMSRLSTLLGVLRESGRLQPNARKGYGVFLIRKLTDSTEDEHLRGKAAKALRSLDDRRALPYLRKIVDDTQFKGMFLRRSAIVTLAKMNDSESFVPISRLLYETDDQDIFMTTIYALGLFRNPAAISPVLRNKERFPSNKTKYLLRDYRGTIEDVFKNNIVPYLLDAIKAVEFIELDELKGYLFPLVTAPQTEIRKAAIEALLKVGKQEDLKSTLELTISEEDPSILQLLERVRSKIEIKHLRPEKSDIPTEEK